MSRPVKPISPDPALRLSSPDTFRARVEANLLFHLTLLPNYIEDSTNWIDESTNLIQQTASAILAGEVGDLTGQAHKLLSVNATEDGVALTEGNFVSRDGDTMTGALLVPQLGTDANKVNAAHINEANITDLYLSGQRIFFDWCRFGPTGAIIESSRGVSSVTRTAQGSYLVNFTEVRDSFAVLATGEWPDVVSVQSAGSINSNTAVIRSISGLNQTNQDSTISVIRISTL